MEAVSFGKGWFRAKKRLTESWDESKARFAHEQRQPYVAVVGNAESIRCFVEANNDYIGVGISDNAKREFLSYQFQEIQPGRLFLTMATHCEFDGETDGVKSSTTYYFKPNGCVTVESEDFATGHLTTKKIQTDVSGNWEAYPVFGDYESIVRIDRETY
jgi:hypothetical protein